MLDYHWYYVEFVGFTFLLSWYYNSSLCWVFNDVLSWACFLYFRFVNVVIFMISCVLDFFKSSFVRCISWDLLSMLLLWFYQIFIFSFVNRFEFLLAFNLFRFEILHLCYFCLLIKKFLIQFYIVIFFLLVTSKIIS